MSEANGDAAEALPKELLRELHAFLSLEAPFLIRDLPQVASEDALEEALLTRIEARSRTGEEFGEDLLYPQLTHREAVDGIRAELESAVRGFFDRRRIKVSLSPHEKRLMFRTMLLTREVDPGPVSCRTRPLSGGCRGIRTRGLAE